MSTITTRKIFVPYWLRRTELPLQEDVLNILNKCNAIRRLLPNVNGDGDEADIEGARMDLRDTLNEIFEKGNTITSPLWAAVMAIRPQVINGRLPVTVTEEIAQAIYRLKNTEYDQSSPEAVFFGRLAARLRQHQINFFRVVITGREPFSAKDTSGQRRTHYFHGIPFSIRKEAGVKLSTHPDNLPSVLKAYQIMAAQTTGHAKIALEEVIADIGELSVNLYPPARPGR